MASLDKLIKDKTKRLTTVPDKFLSNVEKIQKDLYPEIVGLLKNLDTDKSGNIILNNKNLKIATNIKEEIKDIIEDSEYVSIVNEFVLEFEDQAKLTDQLVKKGFDEFTKVRNVDRLLTITQNSSKSILIDSIADIEFANAITNQVEAAISNNATYSETLESLQTIVTGNEKIDGKLKQYAKQVAHDQFALADRSYTSAIAESIGAEWFFYSGSEIETTRPFCGERHNRYYHWKEISTWGNGGATLGMFYPDGNGDWAGKIPGTNSDTIFSTAGGYNCRHSLIPVSIGIVPDEDIERAKAQGYYKEDQTVKQEDSFEPITDEQFVEEIKEKKLNKVQQKEFDEFGKFNLASKADQELQDLTIKNYILNKEELLKRVIEATPKKIINVDDTRKQFIPLGYKGYNAAAVHKASMVLTDDLERYYYNQIKPGTGKIGLWAGGPGSGKTTTIKTLRPGLLKEASYNNDSTLSSKEWALSEIRRILKDGNSVEIPYIFADPEEAWRNVIERAIYNKEEMGRVVPKSVFIRGTKGAYETIKTIVESEELMSNPQLSVYLYDNRYGRGKAKFFTKEAFNSIKFKSNLEKILDDITEEYYIKGLITKDQYEALLQ